MAMIARWLGEQLRCRTVLPVGFFSHCWARWHAHHTPLMFFCDPDWLHFGCGRPACHTLRFRHSFWLVLSIFGRARWCAHYTHSVFLLLLRSNMGPFLFGHVGMPIDTLSTSYPFSSNIGTGFRTSRHSFAVLPIFLPFLFSWLGHDGMLSS